MTTGFNSIGLQSYLHSVRSSLIISDVTYDQAERLTKLDGLAQSVAGTFPSHALKSQAVNYVYNYLHGDHLGSVVATTDRKGDMIGGNKPRYRAYGSERTPSIAALSTDYHFRG